MHYRQARSSDLDDIFGLSRDELGWSSPRQHLGQVLERYPGAVAINKQGICGFAYSNALSSDILRISNLLVAGDHRRQGVGSHLLRLLENGAAEAGYKTLLFPEDTKWFYDGSVRWIEGQGYRSIYDSDNSRIVVKETL